MVQQVPANQLTAPGFRLEGLAPGAEPFVDGNKRIGFAATIVFLEIDGRKFQATEADATVRTLALAAGEMDEAGYAAWLKANTRRARHR